MDLTKLNDALNNDLPAAVKAAKAGEIDIGSRTILIGHLGTALVELVGLYRSFYTTTDDWLIEVTLTPFFHQKIDGPPTRLKTDEGKMTTKTYPMSVILSATTGRMITSIPVSGYRGLKDLAEHLGVLYEDMPQAIWKQHPELNVDTSHVTDWNDWMLDMVKEFGPALEFEGRN